MSNLGYSFIPVHPGDYKRRITISWYIAETICGSGRRVLYDVE